MAAAVSIVSSSGRPLSITFVQGFVGVGAGGQAVAANATKAQSDSPPAPRSMLLSCCCCGCDLSCWDRLYPPKPVRIAVRCLGVVLVLVGGLAHHELGQDGMLLCILVGASCIVFMPTSREDWRRTYRRCLYGRRYGGGSLV